MNLRIFKIAVYTSAGFAVITLAATFSTMLFVGPNWFSVISAFVAGAALNSIFYLFFLLAWQRRYETLQHAFEQVSKYTEQLVELFKEKGLYDSSSEQIDDHTTH